VQGRWLFPGQKKGQHMTTGGVNSLLKDFAKKYDIREDVMHAHAFRHFFAIQSLNNGVDMSLLKDLLGHGSIDTTQIYTQLSSAEQKKRFNEAVKW
jgi:site-specific recombinase XerD